MNKYIGKSLKIKTQKESEGGPNNDSQRAQPKMAPTTQGEESPSLYTGGMRFVLALLLSPAAALAGVVADIPGANLNLSLSGVSGSAPVLTETKPDLRLTMPGQGASLIVPEAPHLVIPESKVVAAPTALIVPAVRALKPEELAHEKPLTGEALAKFVDSLTGGEGKRAQDEKAEGESAAEALKAQFDGATRREEAHQLSAVYFASPAEGPELGFVAKTARLLFSALLPRYDRPVRATVKFDDSKHPSTGHRWTRETGHVIEILPQGADGEGKVPTAFGLEGMEKVSRKVERLLLVVHEYAHAVFDDSVGRKEQYLTAAAYSAMTEGFAVTLEGLFIDRLTADPLAWGLSAQDASDLLKIRRAREQWLASVDTHYAEGVVPFSKAFETAGDEGVLAFVAKLSARRMTDVHRSEPAYQLAVSDPETLAAYVGRDAAHPLRAGFDAVAKLSKGEELDEAEEKAAAAALEAAGPEGRRRLFHRLLRVDLAVEDEDGGTPDVGLVFRLAALSPSAASELAAYLVATVEGPGLGKIAGRGPGPRMNAVIQGAEKLPFSDAQKATWLEKLTAFIMSGLKV